MLLDNINNKLLDTLDAVNKASISTCTMHFPFLLSESHTIFYQACENGEIVSKQIDVAPDTEPPYYLTLKNVVCSSIVVLKLVGYQMSAFPDWDYGMTIIKDDAGAWDQHFIIFTAPTEPNCEAIIYLYED